MEIDETTAAVLEAELKAMQAGRNEAGHEAQAAERAEVAYEDAEEAGPVDPTADFGTKARRSADAAHLNFFSLPMLGLLGVARTAAEGATKYGAHNYLQGLPAHDCINHAMRHLVLWSAGDRSEPHLSHAAWNCMVAEQSAILNPELNAPHLPGPGYTITPAMQAKLDADAPILAAKREKGLFAKLGEWALGRLPEVVKLLAQRKPACSCAAYRAGTGREAACSDCPKSTG